MQGRAGHEVPSDAPSDPTRRGPRVEGWGTHIHTPEEAHHYRVSFPKTLEMIWCPVEGCWGQAMSRTNLQVYFVHHHVRDILVIL